MQRQAQQAGFAAAAVLNDKAVAGQDMGVLIKYEEAGGDLFYGRLGVG